MEIHDSRPGAFHIAHPRYGSRKLPLVAVHEVQRNGPHTPDLGGTATTQDVTAAVMDALPQSLAV